jgi:hypothetical protein
MHPEIAAEAHARLAQRTADQVRRNYEVFRVRLPSLLPDHQGEYALMKDGEIVDFFNAAIEALVTGEERFGIGNFSMQKVMDAPIDLGYFSAMASLASQKKGSVNGQQQKNHQCSSSPRPGLYRCHERPSSAGSAIDATRKANRVC